MKRRTVLIAILCGVFAAQARGQEAPAASPLKPPSFTATRRTVAPREAPAFGTADHSYYRVGAVEFAPDFTDGGAGTYSSTWSYPAVTTYLRFGIQTAWFIAVPHLPGGALLTSLELDDCDTNTFGSHVVLSLFDCDYVGQCADTPLASVSSVDNSFGFDCGFVIADLTGANYTVNNNTRQLLLFANLEAANLTNQLAGAIIGYKLQVSPAPAMATFGDVPPGHPFFQFIEALADAGITGGCGGGNYCPNAPVTRGQMAVFLAKALGLSFPNQ